MASLMTIPEELRDSIIEFVLLEKHTPPPGLKAANSGGRPTIQQTRREGILSWHYGPSNVLYDTAQGIPSSIGLLLVNRAVRKQTKQAISRLFPTGVNYQLDVMFVNEQQLWPTWLHVPSVSSRVNTIDVTFRIFGRNTTQWRSAFVPGNGSPPQIVWAFYWLMEHFLNFGIGNVGAFKQRQSHGRKIEVSVKNINLNFVSGEPVIVPADTKDQKEKWWARQRPGWFEPFEEPQHLTDEELLSDGQPVRMHPKWLAEFVRQQIASLTRVDYHDAEYGAIFHERIGCIKVHAQGKLVHEIDMATILPPITVKPDQGSEWYSTRTFGNIGGDCRVLTFWNWKYRNVLQRQRLDLPLKGPIIWPTLDELKNWRAARDDYRQRVNAGDLCNDRCLCSDRGLEEMLEKGNAMLHFQTSRRPGAAFAAVTCKSDCIPKNQHL